MCQLRRARDDDSLAKDKVAFKKGILWILWKVENKQWKIQCAIRSLPLRCKDQVSKAQDMDELKSTAQKILIMPAG